MMKLIEVEYLNGTSTKHFLFYAPANLTIDEENIVLVDTAKGPVFGMVCAVVPCSNEDTVYKMLTRFAGATEPLRRVLAVYTKSIELHWDGK